MLELIRLQKIYMMWLGRGQFVLPCWSCFLHDLILDKQKENWMANSSYEWKISVLLVAYFSACTSSRLLHTSELLHLHFSHCHLSQVGWITFQVIDEPFCIYSSQNLQNELHGKFSSLSESMSGAPVDRLPHLFEWAMKLCLFLHTQMLLIYIRLTI